MTTTTTLLDQLRQSGVTMDLDSMDPECAKAYGPFCNMTSNQAIVHNEMMKPERKELLLGILESVRKDGIDQESIVDEVIVRFTVQLAKSVLSHISGRVLAQVTPSAAYDVEKTVAASRKLRATFEAAGIPVDRICIKIPSTPESLLACKILNAESLRTLGTVLFSVPQALAASQAGCLFISPYFNELGVYWHPTMWTEYQDPFMQHPSSWVLKEILQAYRKTSSETKVMAASIKNVKEAQAIFWQAPHHITIPASILLQLSDLPAIGSEYVQKVLPELESTSDYQINYLTDDAKALKEAISSDKELSRKIKEALEIFQGQEDLSKELIKALL